jgi:hypothetical protein
MQQLDGILASTRIVFALSALALLAVIVALIRRGSIKEKYALLWLPLGLAFLGVSVFPEILVRISARVHLHYMTLVVLGVIVVYTNILLYFTARMSQMREDLKKLSQEIALIRARQSLPASEGAAPAASGWLPAAGEKTRSPV